MPIKKIPIIDPEPLPDFAFRNLSDEDEIEFRKWARSNYTVGTPIRGLWHYIIRDECMKMNREAGISGGY